MHGPVKDPLLDEAVAAARLDARVNSLAAEVGTNAPEDRWMRTAGAHRRERLMQEFLTATPAAPPAHRAGRSAVLALSGLLAAAAALVMFWRPTARPSHAPNDPLGYQLAVEGQVAARRGEPVAQVATFRSGERVRLLLTPPAPVHATLDVRIIATHAARRIEPNWSWQIDPQEGVIEIEGPVDDLLNGAAGRWTLTVELRDAGPMHALRERVSTRVEVSP